MKVERAVTKSFDHHTNFHFYQKKVVNCFWQTINEDCPLKLEIGCHWDKITITINKGREGVIKYSISALLGMADKLPS